MSLKECIEVGQDVGALTDSQAREATDIYENLVLKYTNELGPEQAAERAARETVEILKSQTSEKSRIKFLQLKKWSQIQKDLNSYNNGEDLGDAAINLIERQEGRDVNYFGFSNRATAVKGQIFAKMDSVLSTFKRGVLGNYSNKTTAFDLVKIAFGEATDNLNAIELYKGWSEAIEYARVRFNRAGGSIPKMSDWGLPQIHDAMAIRKVGYDVWKEKISPLLDLNKMVNPITKIAYTADELEGALKASYEAILTDGWSKVKEGQSQHRSALYNKGKQHRFFVFKDAESWMNYQKEFGTTHPFEAMMGYISSISKDIAMIETFGPNPTAMIRSLKAFVEKKSSIKDLEGANTKGGDKARASLNLFDKMYAEITGANNSLPENILGNIFIGTRQLVSSAFLGSASITALGDLATQKVTARFNGLSETQLIKNILKYINPLKVKDNGRFAIQAGLIAETWIQLAAGQARYVSDITGPMITQRLADATMRLSLLSPWTQAGRFAFGMEFMASFARNSGKNFDQLDAPFQNALKRAGLDVNWDVMRKAKLFDNNGVQILRAAEIEKLKSVSAEEADLIATKYLELINYETNFAVPTSSLKAKAGIIGQDKANSFIGEIKRSALLFTNFPITMMNTHITRTVNETEFKNKLAYGSNLLISTTLMGALILQLKNISQGKDPQSIKSKQFWMDALMQGGGLGLAGDYLLSNRTKYGKDLGSQLAGPVFEFGGDAIDLTFGNMKQAMLGQDTEVIKETVKFGTKYMPLKSIWYSRLLVERNLLETLTKWSDPKAEAKLRQKAMRLRRETGQEYFWKPGKGMPSRGPDLSKMFEEPPK